MGRMKSIWTIGLALAWCAWGCGKAPREAPPPPPAPAIVPEAVSGARALDEVRALLALGPRDAGTPGAEKAAQHLRDRLQALGVAAEIQEFADAAPNGPTTFRNVLGRIPGQSDRILMFASHYDTKVGIPGFVGANDSGSSTGLLLELARVLAQGAPHAMEIRFAFFDGEECVREYGPMDGFHGSRHMAETMAADGSLTNVAALILLDMVGDRDLTITIPRNGAPRLAALAFDAARAENARAHFQLFPYTVGDDHAAFFERGVPAIDLIDFQYGSAPQKNDYWHTPQDALDKLAPESLEIVGRVAARMAAALLAEAAGK